MSRTARWLRRLACVVGLLAAAAASSLAAPAVFRSAWPRGIERTWIGPEFWANPLQDWRIADGRLECATSGPNRNVGLLTRQVGPDTRSFSLSVRLGRLSDAGHGWAGFRVGAKGRVFGVPELQDYRDDVLRGKGLDCGISSDGQLFIGSAGRVGAGRLPERGLPRKRWRVTHVDSTQGGNGITGSGPGRRPADFLAQQVR